MARQAKEALLPVEFLHQVLTYDPDTGFFHWKARSSLAWNRRWAGKRAGSLNDHGYRFLKISVRGRNLNVTEHRVAWAMQTGAWPFHDIDHENRQRADNRFINLRDFTALQNAQNTAPGWGAYPNGNSGTWRASICVNGVYRWLGCFPSETEARQAYLAARMS